MPQTYFRFNLLTLKCKISLVYSPQMFVVNLEMLEVSVRAVSNPSDRSLEKWLQPQAKQWWNPPSNHIACMHNLLQHPSLGLKSCRRTQKTCFKKKNNTEEQQYAQPAVRINHLCMPCAHKMSVLTIRGFPSRTHAVLELKAKHSLHNHHGRGLSDALFSMSDYDLLLSTEKASFLESTKAI